MAAQVKTGEEELSKIKDLIVKSWREINLELTRLDKEHEKNCERVSEASFKFKELQAKIENELDEEQKELDQMVIAISEAE